MGMGRRRGTAGKERERIHRYKTRGEGGICVLGCMWGESFYGDVHVSLVYMENKKGLCGDTAKRGWPSVQGQRRLRGSTVTDEKDCIALLGTALHHRAHLLEKAGLATEAGSADFGTVKVAVDRLSRRRAVLGRGRKGLVRLHRGVFDIDERLVRRGLCGTPVASCRSDALRRDYQRAEGFAPRETAAYSPEGPGDISPRPPSPSYVPTGTLGESRILRMRCIMDLLRRGVPS